MPTGPWDIKLVFLTVTVLIFPHPPTLLLLLLQLRVLLVMISKHSQAAAGLYITHYSKCSACKILSSLQYYRTGLVSLVSLFLHKETDKCSHAHVIPLLDRQARI